MPDFAIHLTAIARAKHDRRGGLAPVIWGRPRLAGGFSDVLIGGWRSYVRPFGAEPSPLALPTAKVPIKDTRSARVTGYGVSFVGDPDRFVHHVRISVSPAPNGKFSQVTGSTARAHARSKVSVRNAALVVMTADMIGASLGARATVPSRAGLPAPRDNDGAPPQSLAAIAPPRTSRRLRERLPCWLIEPGLSLPPLEFCRGVDPSQAEKSRPDLKIRGSGALATIAEAAIFPIPGVWASHRLTDHFACAHASVLNFARGPPELCVCNRVGAGSLWRRRLSGAARKEALMRNIAFIASLICCLVLPDMVSAMPVAPGATVAKAASSQIVPAYGGCGPRRHRGPRGGCRWNRY